MSAFNAAAEVRALFDSYLATLVPLFAGESDDLAALLGHFAVPAAIVMFDACLQVPDREALARLLAAQIEQSRRANYASTTTHRLDIRVSNARAAWIEGGFSRYAHDGPEPARFGTIYLAIRPADRWQIASLVMTDI